MHLLHFSLGGPGLHDPCEKEFTDTLANMTDQEAEAITHAAQVRSLKPQLTDSIVIP